MGRKRKVYTDKFKLSVAKEALKSGANRAEVAAKHSIAPSTLSEWIDQFLDGKLETDEQRELRASYEKLKEQHAITLMELGRKQLEVEKKKKKRESHGKAWMLVAPGLHGEGGSTLTIQEQCDIIGISRATYYGNKSS